MTKYACNNHYRYDKETGKKRRLCSCSLDKDCPMEIIDGRNVVGVCKRNQCFNIQKDCYRDSHCAKGEYCLNKHCLTDLKCSADRDCIELEYTKRGAKGARRSGLRSGMDKGNIILQHCMIANE